MMRLFSIKRAGVSLILGFLLPLSYALLLSFVFDFVKRPTPQVLVWPFGWPRPLWILLLGRQPLQADLIFGIVFLAVCNVLLYGSIVYAVLSVLSLLRRKPVDSELPPLPRPF
jgi:hypothetical protein